MDYFRLTRQFFECTTEEERLRFLDVLFGITAADGGATFEEIEEIRSISNVLKLTHQQFIDAKLKSARVTRGLIPAFESKNRSRGRAAIRWQPDLLSA